MASQKTRKNQQKDSSSAKRSKPVSKGGDSDKSAAKPKASVKAEKGKPEKVKLVKKAKPEPGKPEKAKPEKVKLVDKKVKPDKKAKPEPSKPEKVKLEKKAKPELSKPEQIKLEKKAVPEKGKLEKAAPEKTKLMKGKPEKAKVEKGAPEKLLKSAKAEAPKMREALADKPRKMAEAAKETAKEPPKKAPEKALKAPEKSPPVKGAAVPVKKAPEREEIQPVKRLVPPPAPPPPLKGKEPPKVKPAVVVGKPEGKEAKAAEKKAVEPKAVPVPKAMPKEEPKARKEAAPPAQREITPKLVPLAASAAAGLGKRGTTEERAIELEKRIDAQPDEFKKRYYDSFDMSWIYHDSALEGVVYTFEELRAALFPQPVTSDSNLQPSVEDIRRHKEAILFVRDFATKKRLPITVDLIKKIYLILHPEEGDVKTVKYRKDIPQHRLYFHEYAPPDKIAYKVRQVVDWLNDPETRKTRNGIRIAARAHFDLLKVYPFPTDSGKVARLFMNLLLMRSGLPPSIIHSTERQRYYEGLKSSATTVLQMVQEAVENALASVEKLLNEHETGKRAFIS